jgi:hypothetical protein
MDHDLSVNLVLKFLPKAFEIYDELSYRKVG